MNESSAGAGAVDHLASVVIPCIEVDPLTVRCATDCAALSPGSEIQVLSDFPDTEGRLTHLAGVKTVVTGKVTIAAKRNLAARSTDRPYLAFIDSDAYPLPGWLPNAIAHLDREPALWAVGGPNLSPTDCPLGERYVGCALKSPLVSGKWTYRKTIKPARQVDDLPSCNLIVRRKRFLEIGGMDEALITGEDMEFCARLRAAGGNILYAPDVLVHHKARNLRSFIAQRLTYGTSVPGLLLRRRNFDFLALSLPAIFVLFVISGSAGLFWPVYGHLWLTVMALYVVALGIEAVRHSDRAVDVPGVFLALFLGNIMPGIGTLGRLAGCFRDTKKIYRNDQ